MPGEQMPIGRTLEAKPKPRTWVVRALGPEGGLWRYMLPLGGNMVANDLSEIAPACRNHLVAVYGMSHESFRIVVKVIA